MKSKFKAGDILYFKYPSRYSRSKDPDRVECIIKVVAAARPQYSDHYGAQYDYIISLIKTIKTKRDHWSSGDTWRLGIPTTSKDEFRVDSIEIETYSRQLTPAEKVLYG